MTRKMLAVVVILGTLFGACNQAQKPNILSQAFMPYDGGSVGCRVPFGALVTVLEVRKETVVLEYREGDYGYSCRFSVNRSGFETFNTRYAEVTADHEAVRRVLGQNYHGKVQDAGEYWWITVVNPDRVEGMDLYGAYCAVGKINYGGHVSEGGSTQVRGKANGRTLYEYTAYRTPTDTKDCPSGVLFWLER